MNLVYRPLFLSDVEECADYLFTACEKVRLSFCASDTA
jgi:hypothetical protein